MEEGGRDNFLRRLKRKTPDSMREWVHSAMAIAFFTKYLHLHPASLQHPDILSVIITQKGGGMDLIFLGAIFIFFGITWLLLEGVALL
jgi:hypothetical protein